MAHTDALAARPGESGARLKNKSSPWLPAVRRLHTGMLLALQGNTAGGRQGCNTAPHARHERTTAAATALRGALTCMQRGAKSHVIINQAQPSRTLANEAPPRLGPLWVMRRGCAQTAVSRKAERGTQEAEAQLAGQQLQEDTVTHQHWPVRKPSISYSGRIRSRNMRSMSVLDSCPRFAACASYAARASQETARRMQRGPHMGGTEPQAAAGSPSCVRAQPSPRPCWRHGAAARARKYRRGPGRMHAQPGGSPRMLSARERPRAALHGARAQLAESALHAALDVGVAHHQHAGLVAAHQRHLWVG
jgi:hypothetical protein